MAGPAIGISDKHVELNLEFSNLEYSVLAKTVMPCRTADFGLNFEQVSNLQIFRNLKKRIVRLTSKFEVKLTSVKPLDRWCGWKFENKSEL